LNNSDAQFRTTAEALIVRENLNGNGNSSASASKKKPFTLAELPSVWQLDMKTSWVVEGLIPEGAVTLLSSESGVGKSTFALAIACAVAHGAPFLGMRTIQGPVVYVDGENPGAVVRERIERLGIAETDALKVWGGWNTVAPKGPLCEEVIQWAREYRGLIVYDSLIQFHTGSEQDSSETRRYMTQFRALANIGASPFILHHTGKGENAREYRESSDIKASVDQAFIMEELGESDGEAKALRLKPFKMRIAEAPTLRIDFHGTGVFTIAASASRTNKEILFEIIARNPKLSSSRITSLAGSARVSKHRTEELLLEGVREGSLVVETGPNNSKLYSRNGNN
jgi:hypothetical protein